MVQFLLPSVGCAYCSIIGQLPVPLFPYQQAFAFRSLSGLANGNVGVVKTYLTEILDATNQAMGFSIITYRATASWLTFLCSPFTCVPVVFIQAQLLDRSHHW